MVEHVLVAVEILLFAHSADFVFSVPQDSSYTRYRNISIVLSYEAQQSLSLKSGITSQFVHLSHLFAVKNLLKMLDLPEWLRIRFLRLMSYDS